MGTSVVRSFGRPDARSRCGGDGVIRGLSRVASARRNLRADHDRHRLGGDADRHRATPGLFLADDPGGQAGQRRHVEQAEADAEASEVVGARDRETVHATPPRTSRRRAPASRRVDGGNRTARTRSASGSGEPGPAVRWSIDGVPFSLNSPGPACGATSWAKRSSPDGPERLSARRDTVPDGPPACPHVHPCGPVGGYRRPRRERREGGLSTSSSTKLST